MVDRERTKNWKIPDQEVEPQCLIAHAETKEELRSSNWLVYSSILSRRI